jgi:parallel beta-helix repeat protein
VWAEQTYGNVGARCDDGAGGTAELGAAGACYGGQRGIVSDDAAALATAQHVTRVTLVAANAAGVDFAFSFNAVINNLAGDAQDDDAGANRTVQGSLRQFIQNANAITGANTMRFVPAANTNATDGGGNNWWQISVTQALPAFTDANTTVDGTAYNFSDGTTVRNTNNVALGYSGPVGVGVDGVLGTADELNLSGLNGPELEIVNDRATNTLEVGLDLQADSSTVRDLAIFGFGDSDIYLSTNVRVGINGSATNYTNVIIEDSVIGTGAAGFSDPGLAARSAYNNIGVYHADSGFIRNNLIGYAGNFGIFLSGDADGWTVQSNEIRGNGVIDSGRDGIDIGNDSSGTTVSGNLFAENAGSGIDSWSGAGNNLIENNTFDQNGQSLGETSAIRVFGTNSTIRFNDIHDNAGPGVLVVANNILFGPSGIPATQNRISKNRFSSNGSNAIDLLANAGDANVGDGITINLGTDADAGNIDLDYPVIASAILSAGTTTVVGTTCANCEVEVYRAVADGDGSDTSGADDYGEGVEYLGTANADGAGNWNLPGLTLLVLGDEVSAIAIDASDNTSEFGINVTVTNIGLGSLLAQYWIDEAASGQSPTELADEAATPLNMPLGYVGPSPAWSDGSGGNRHLRFNGTDGTDTGGAIVDIGGTKIDAIHGSMVATLEVKYAMDSDVCTNNGDRIFGISDGDASANGWLAVRERSGRDTLQVRWSGVGTVGVYAIGSGTPSCPIDSASTVHWVIDTTQAVPANRVKAYIDGVAATVTAIDGSSLPPLNATIDLGAGTRRMYVGRSHTPFRTFRGRIWYAAIYQDALSAALVGSQAAAINACDDLNVPCSSSIAGTVFEDVNGDANPADAVNRPNVDVYFYLDGGDGQPDGVDDTLVTGSPVTTDGSGNYSSPTLVPATATYWVVVDSKTVTPNAVFNGGFAQGDVWPEQTYGTAGAWCDDWAGGVAVLGAAGACYGGQASVTSDNATTLAGAEHVTRVAVAPSNVNGVNFGFSFNNVVNTRDGDDDGGNNRSIQGSLRQFMQNSNAISATLSSVFTIPTSDPGYDGTGNGEFTIQPTSALPIIDDPVVLDATTQTANIGDTNPAGPEVELDGSDPGSGNEGFLLQGAGSSTIRGFVINRFKEDGIEIESDGNTIEGNFIGTDVTGTLDRGNGLRGINIAGSDTNVIGGTDPGDGNLISGNDNEGLNIRDGSAGNTVQGNFIGTNASGAAAIGNAWEGIQVWDSGANNTIGGTALGAGNVVSGNGRTGIRIDGATSISTTIQGNTIGLNAVGDGAIANGWENVSGPSTDDGGILIASSAGSTTIGGAAANAGNLVSGNDGNGITFDGSSGNTIQGNLIGTNAAGDAAIGNTLEGFLLKNGSAGNLIGGVGVGNTVAGNNWGAIRLRDAGTTGNTIQGNWFGTNSGGDVLGQGFGNVEFDNGAVNNLLGGVNAGEGNVIAYADDDGVFMYSGGSDPVGNAILRNSIYGNDTDGDGDGIGIDLEGGTQDPVYNWTANDSGDGDGGPNALQNFPVLTSASTNGTTVTIVGSLNSIANNFFRVEFFANAVPTPGPDPSGYGQGQRYLGYVDVTTNGSGDANFSPTLTASVAVGEAVSATATRSNAAFDQWFDTSEFAANIAATGNTNISGTVYEDVNYGGGVGRNLAAAQAAAGAFAIERDTVTVELYDAGGSYSDTTTTAADGTYSFTGLTPANYIVRVVNSTVTSTRVGSDASEVVVQTFRIDGDGEPAGTGANKVGGEQPIDQDAPANDTTQTLADLQALANQYTQSIVTVDASGGDVTGVDFGFNFDTVVNTNNADQGSLRQFILNANLLTDNAALAQTGRTAGVENSIFMIPGTGDPLKRPADPNYSAAPLSYTITPTTALLTISDPVTLDGTTQPDFPGTPIIVLDGNDLAANGLTIGGTADSSTIRGFVIRDFGGDGIRIPSGSTNNLIAGNYIGRLGSNGTAAAAGEENTGEGINILGDNTTIGGTAPGDGNVISGNDMDGILVDASDVTIQGNFIGLDAGGDNALANTDDGIDIDGGTNLLVGGSAIGTGNVISANGDDGIDLNNGGLANVVIQGNFIGTDVTGTLDRGNLDGGIVIESASTVLIGGTASDEGNVIAYSKGSSSGVHQRSDTAHIGRTIFGNAIHSNNRLGINLDRNDALGTSDAFGVTANDYPDVNGVQNFPDLVSAGTTGATVTVTGTLSVSAGESFRIVVFANTAADPSGYGEGERYLGFADVTDGGAGDTDGLADGTITLSVVLSPAGGVAAGEFITATATRADGTFTTFFDTSEFAQNVVAVASGSTIAGTIFEDINYGGGDGRDYAAADTSAQASGWAAGAIGSSAGVVVELYEDQSGNFIKIDDTTTDANGDYAFASLSDDTYRVRVVNATVVSNRGSNGTGNTPLAVQTFRNDPDSGGGVTSEVGGASPSSQDSGPQVDGTDLSTITAQSVTEIVVAGASVSNVDYGFNFDTIVNANDADQGTLRQFLLNSNELDNVNLDQQDNPAGVAAVTKNAGDEHSIFMIPAAELVATIDGGGGTVMLIQPSSALPTIIDDDTTLDGSTQTAYTGDTNTAVAEVSTGPEVIVDLQRSVNANILNVTGNGVIIDSMGLGRSLGSSTVGLYLDGVTNAVVRNSTIWDTGDSTISLNNNAASNQILNNVIRNAGLDNDPGDGISLLGGINNNTISGNTIVDHAAYGIDFITSSSDNNIVTNNLIKGNGISASAQNGGIGLRFGDNNTFSQNTITQNSGEGLLINTGNTGNIISQNSIFNNGGLGADLSNVGNEGGDGVTLNDNLDPDTGGNDRQNFPVITSAIWNGANTVVQGTLNSTAGATFDIEVFSNAVCNGDTGGIAQADTYGEGETYRATDNVTTDGVTGDTSFTVNIPVDLTGQSITATATNTATNDTSEFSQCEVVVAAIYSISGTVYHDVDADADVAEGGTLTFPVATVHLYQDSGNAVIDGGETLIATTTTDGTGNYSFSGLTNGTYYVQVDSTTLAATGYNGGFTINDVWAEQTYAVSGAASGAGFTATAGALYGGRNPDTSDDPAAITTAEHAIRRTIVGADATGVNFGFSFNAVVNTRGDAIDDDGGGTNRLQQGTLRQFILNANAVSGANVMRFVPAVATNESGGGGNWWTITVASVMPVISDADTTIDGTAYSSADGTTILDTNAGQVGAGGTVGVDGLALDRIDRPELELDGAGAFGGDGLVVDAGNATIQNLALNRFGTGSWDAHIHVNNTVTAAAGEAIITGNLVGTNADGSDSGGNEFIGILVHGAATITNNYVAYVESNGVSMSSFNLGIINTEQVNFINNEIAFSNFTGSSADAISDVSDNALIRGNYIHDHTGAQPAQAYRGKAMEIWYDVQGILVENNTIANMQVAGIGLNDGASSTVIRRNIITGTTGSGGEAGAGILISSYDYSGPPGMPADNRITENSIYDNAGLGIDLDARTGAINHDWYGDGVTANDPDDGDTGANALQNFPVLAWAATDGAQVRIFGTLDSTATTNFRLEFFASAAAEADPSGYGEGRRFIGNADVSTDGSGDATFNVLLASAVAVGEVVTATATRADAGFAAFFETSEFAQNVTAAAALDIDGTVYEDINGDANLADGVGRDNVTVVLFQDGGDNQPDSGDDTFITTTTTGGGGSYSFSTIPPATYWVVVDSKTVTPNAGYSGGSGQGDVWAEQTYGFAGSWCADGAGGTAEIGASGSCFGGQGAAVSDNVSAPITVADLATAEHVIRVVAAADVNGVNFGFSFNNMVNTLAGDAQDDDGGNNRTVQGSLRQFIQNANAIAGANMMRFVPAMATNATGGGNNWWRISITSTLPIITADNTTLDGTAYSRADGVTVRNDNPTVLGTGGTVGVDALALSQVPGPELEIVGNNILLIGFEVQGNDVTIRRFAIYGFGDGVTLLTRQGNILLDQPGVLNLLIEANVLGSSAASFTDPGAGVRTGGANIWVETPDGGTIRNNLIGFGGFLGIFLFNNANNWTVENNEVRANGLIDLGTDGIDINADSSNATVLGNLFEANNGSGVDMFNGGSTNLIENNTIRNNGIGGQEDSGIRIYGDDHTIRRNIITTNAGSGIMITNDPGGSPPHDRNRISQNAIFNNGKIGVDLHTGAENTALGTAPFITANDALDPDGGANLGQNFPVITSAVWNGANTVVQGTLNSNAGGNFDIELFSNAVCNGDAAGNPAGAPNDYGEGETYRMTVNNVATDGSGDANFNTNIPINLTGQYITATAINTATDDTSEFSQCETVVVSVAISGTVYEDVNYGGGAGRDFAAADASAQTSGWAAGAIGSGPAVVVELYREIGGAFIRIDETNTDLNGDYSFSIPADDTYRVRVVNGTVLSNRGSNGTGNPPLAVQTFRNDPDSGGGVTNEVGGADPAAQDDGVQANGVNLATISAQSVTEIVIAGAGIGNVDFGFNFDTIVNTNNAGQGSLRQFLLNSNELDNVDLDQQDNPVGVGAVTKNAGDEHSIFMIPAAELAATIDGGAGQVMLIQLTSAMPPITDDNTAVDGSTQTAFTGDSNTAVAETTTGPEVIVDLQRTVSADALQINANAVIVDALGLAGTLGGGTNGVGIEAGVSGAIVRNNTMFSTGASTLKLESGASNNQILNNVLRNAGLDVATADGFVFDGNNTNNTVSGNQIVANAGYGIDVVSGGNNGNTFSNNLIKGSGTGGSQRAGIAFRGGDNNTISQNTITENAGEGIFVNDGDSGNRITQNSIFNNGALGADMSAGSGTAGDGVSANDNLDPDTGGNSLQNFPVIISAIWNGVNTVVQGNLNSSAGGNFDIELFSSTVCNGDTLGNPTGAPNDFGEGEAYRITVNNVVTDGSGNANFNTNIPVNLTGQFITGAAIDTATNDTSEFSQCEVAVASVALSGTVYEDPNGDANLADGVTRDNVTVALFRDGGDNQPDSGDDTFINSTTTDGVGDYSFSGLAPATYWVIVDSKTVTPNGGYNGGFGQGDVWPEQTYGFAGSWCDDGAGGTAELGAAGACYGGQDSTISDDVSAPITVADLATAEHVTRVVVAASVNGVDFGFSFNNVVNTRDGDDDGSNNRTIQGSMRQFIQNANVVSGANAMRFVPAGPTNAAGGGGNWWRINPTSTLDSVTDADTTIDGRAYDRADGVSVVNPNPGSLGTGGTVGVDGLALSQVARPELEIADTTGINMGLNITAADVTVLRLSIWAFGQSFNPANNNNANIQIGNVSGAIIEENVIGTPPDSFSDPGASRTLGPNIRSINGDNGTIRNNLIGFSRSVGIYLSTNADTWLVEGNEIRGNALDFGALDGIDLPEGSINATIRANLITANLGAGVDMYRGGGQHTIENNTVTNHGAGGLEDSGVRLYGVDSTVQKNIITANAGSGVMIVNNDGGGPVSIPFDGNLISQNSIYSNGKLGIDLHTGAENNDLGTFPYFTLNDVDDVDSGANLGQNFPVITSAVYNGANTIIEGTLHSNAGANFDIELFSNTVCNGDNYGEGQTYLTTVNVTTDGSGNATFNTTVAVDLTGLYITATAINTVTDDTSEFSACVEVAQPATIEFELATASDLEANGGNIPQLIVNGTLTTDQSIAVNVTGGTAATPADFTNTATVTIPAGTYVAAVAATINLSIVDDGFVEPDETIDLQLANPGTGLTIGDADSDATTQSTHIYTITDNDTAAVTVDDVTEIEGTGLLFTVSLDNAVAGAFTVDMSPPPVAPHRSQAPRTMTTWWRP